MCRIFAGQAPESCASETRSLRLRGYGTPIRLERAVWATLDEIAAGDGLSAPQFITRPHDEVLEMNGAAPNFTPLPRCGCLARLSRRIAVSRRVTPPRLRDTPRTHTRSAGLATRNHLFQAADGAGQGGRECGCA